MRYVYINPIERLDIQEIPDHFTAKDCPDTLWRPLQGYKVSTQYGFSKEIPKLDYVFCYMFAADDVKDALDEQCKRWGVKFILSSTDDGLIDYILDENVVTTEDAAGIITTSFAGDAEIHQQLSDVKEELKDLKDRRFGELEDYLDALRSGDLKE